MIEDIQQKATKLAALNAVAAVINQTLPIEDIMDLVLHEVIDVMAVDAGGIRIIDESTNELLISSSQGLAREYIDKVDRIRIGEGVVGHVASTGEIAIKEDFSADSQLYSKIAAEEGFRTFVVVPLKTTKKVIGTLGMVTRHVREFTEEEIDLMEAIGHQIGIAFENAQLRLENIEAERLASIGRVATSIAHDIRSPLGGILRSAEFLGRSEISSETRKKLSRAIVSMSNRLISTSQEILDFVRGEKIDLVKAPCDISDFLDEILTMLEVDFSEQGIEVVKDIIYTGSIVIDKNRIAQVIYNIAVNARDAMPYGGKFTVSSKKVNNHVELSFSDTGPGIPAVLGDKIFEPYFSYGKREGVGLGLAIARSIVENHQGKLTFENLKKGTKFIVSIPL
jgi:signal transduction histidine kinase